jgi:hypothetical protein
MERCKAGVRGIRGSDASMSEPVRFCKGMERCKAGVRGIRGSDARIGGWDILASQTIKTTIH